MRPILMTLVALILGHNAFGNRVNTPDLPINHCYHWLNERSQGFLSFKYKQASQNQGELSFYTTGGNGAMAGPGLYCAKTPIGSYTYGDRVVRIDLVDDVVFTDIGSNKVCGTNGGLYPADVCRAKTSDVYFYNSTNDWYVIQNPQAIKSWSANSDQLIADLNAIKEDGDSSANAHIDVTLQLMQAEVQKLGKLTFTNGRARLSLDKILKNPSLLNSIPVLSLIGMIAADTKLSETEKSKLLTLHIERALKDNMLSIADYTGLFSQQKSLLTLFVAAANKLDFNHLENINTAVLIGLFSKAEGALTKQQATKLWENTFVSPASLDSILATELSNTSILRETLLTAMPSVQKLGASLKPHNLVPFLTLLNKYADAGARDMKNYVKMAFGKILTDQHVVDFKKIYGALSNDQLSKETALLDVISEQSKNQFSNNEPITTGTALDLVAQQLPSSQLAMLQKQILNLPIKVDNHLTYLYLEDFINNKVSLPSFYTFNKLVSHLAERSISERSLGSTTTNTFRLVLSNLYFLSQKYIKTSADKKVAAQEVAEAFLNLAASFNNTHQGDYAYIALQNAFLFQSDLDIQHHPIEDLFDQQASLEQGLERLANQILPSSLDTSVFDLLVWSHQHGNKKATQLLGSTLKYLSSAELSQRLKSKDFATANAEKKNWANVVQTKQGRTKVFSDFCHFTESLEKNLDHFKGDFPTATGSVLSLRRTAQANFCQKVKTP